MEKDSKNIIGQRIAEICGSLSYREFSEAIQAKTGVYISHSSLQKYVTGEREPPRNKVEVLAQFAAKPLYWFYLEEEQGIALPPGAHKQEAVSQLPILGVIRAGEPIYASENIIGYRPVEMERVKNGEYFYLQVKGDSMMGSRIMEGDLVLVRCQEEVENGEIAIVIIEREEATLKRVYRTNGQLILQPDNPKYQPLILDRGDVRIIGKVVEVVFKP